MKTPARFALVLALTLPGAAQGVAGVRVPRLQFTQFKLPNGMQVVLSADPTLPVATEALLVNAGARDEKPGQSGFAHLFEHLMFEGSRDAPKGVFDHLIEGYGGNDNASTHQDYTFFYENIPTNALPTAMWLDADRLAALAVTATNMKNQIAVVEEERRMRVNSAAYGPLLYVDLDEAAFQNWQNAHPVIGSFKDLNAATLAEVRQFFEDYYSPRNLILVIVGDIDLVQTRQEVEHYFGWIPNRGRPTPVDTKEPPQTQEKSKTVTDPQAKLPALAVAWQGPPRDTPDFYALTMLGQLLFNGESSRLYQSLVKTNQVALEVDGGMGFPQADFTDYKAPGLFSGLVIYKPVATADQVEKLIYQQIEQVEATGVSDAELSRLRTKFSSAWIRSEQTTLDRARLLALATLFDGKPDAANTELGNFLAVTSRDLERVAREYLIHSRSTVLIDQPAAATAAAAKGGK